MTIVKPFCPVVYTTALKTKTGQRSLTVAKVFVTNAKLCRPVTMTGYA